MKITGSEIEEAYELDRIYTLAFKDSSVLLNNRFCKQCASYVEALTSGDTVLLLKTWQDFAESKKEKMGNPEKYMENFYEKSHSVQRFTLARIDLITFGWNNCANEMVFHLTEDGSFERKFKELFKTIVSNCEGCD